MSRCKLTNMNLRNIRKSREYQCLLIDLVKANVVGKSAAEDLLGYTIPAGLLGTTTPVTPVDDDDDEEEEENLVTLVYFNRTNWETLKYNLTDDPDGEGIIEFAKAQFGDDTINRALPITENPEYVEGESAIDSKYIDIDPTPETIEPGMLIECYHAYGSGDENPGEM